ncbi:MAG TPA: presqualene diphosphate synthase HpnD [Vicinamibacteria bacterium]|nr:presqualene diphosphate synthase HpnD [Vicinamibacteria bacterium]
MESASARIARESGSSFYYAFRILPREKRRAIEALYSFCRVVDDCVDEPGGEGEAGLLRWLDEAYRCYQGRPTTPLGRDLAEALFQFPIPRACFEDIVGGCRMDLVVTRYATFADLRVYCERVASAVGLAAIEVFGYRHPDTRRYAVELGVALQLTNILRDLGPDAARGRLYVPVEDLRRDGVGEEEFLCGAAHHVAPAPALLPLLRSQARRARAQYEAARSLLPREDRAAMAPAEIMAAVYRCLLDRVEAGGFPFRRRVALSRPRRAWIALRALLRSRRP